MTERRATTVTAAKFAIAGMFVAGSALAMAGQAAADPEVPVVPVPGQPVVEELAGPVEVAPLPVGEPPVPEIQNQQYGGPGGLGYLKDLWRAARSGNPEDLAAPMGEGQVGGAPIGAGPAPQLPPGYTSLTAPESSTPATLGTNTAGGPALPEGYYPLDGPPPPDYAVPVADPAVPPVEEPVIPTP